MKKSSDALRRQLQQEDLSWWQKLRERFRRKPDPFQGIDRLPIFTKYLKTLRPWDATPSEHYLEVLRQRNYWYDNPPPLWLMMVYLAALVAVNVVVAFAPVVWNYDIFTMLWRDLKKPGYVYEGGVGAVFTWLMVHLTSSFAPWFVFLTGGWVANRWCLLPYACMLACETLLADLLFGARRLDYTAYCCALCLLLCVVSLFSLGTATRLAAATLFPLLAVFAYLTFLCFAMWDLNGARYLPAT